MSAGVIQTRLPRRVLGRVEAWAAAAPLLCAVHCLAAPLLVALAPALAPGEAAERAFMAASLVLAGVASALGWRAHRRLAPPVIVAAGALLWLAHLTPAPIPEVAATAGASVLMAAGTLWGARLRHRARCHRCGCVAHAHPSPEPDAASKDAGGG
jgi:MerC mercury resistance protein